MITGMTRLPLLPLFATVATVLPLPHQGAWAAEPAAALPPAIASALQTAGVPAEAVSLLVLPVDASPSGPARLAHQAQTVRQMASVMKLFTTGAALSTLGPAYVWRTDVALGGPLKPNGKLDGPLRLRGSGDPGLVLENVQLMMARWRGAGLKDIKGDLLIDRHAFDVPPHDPAAFDGQGLKPYNAGPDALLLNHQSVILHVMPDAARPGQVRVSMEPALDEVRLQARIQLKATGACGDWREAMSLDMRPASGWTQHGVRPWVLSVQGPYPAACGARDWPVLWQGEGAGDYAARLLHESQVLLGQLGDRQLQQVDLLAARQGQQNVQWTFVAVDVDDQRRAVLGRLVGGLEVEGRLEARAQAYLPSNAASKRARASATTRERRSRLARSARAASSTKAAMTPSAAAPRRSPAASAMARARNASIVTAGA